MVNVIASVLVRQGKLSEFLEIFKPNVSIVRKEKGCIEYAATVDLDSGLPPQSLNENMVTVIEKWDSLEALLDHLASPHMAAYQEKTQSMVVEVSIKVLQEV
jgi:quinol monooxygenase YgiN